MVTTCDVLVVGAGPGGGSAALHAARLGLISLDLINTYSAFTGIADIESQDEYAFLRDAYLERRKYEVNDGLSEEDLSQDEDFEDF